MTKEDIIEIIKLYSITRHFGEYREIMPEDLENIANELLEYLEQEKKKEVRKFVEWYKKVLESDYDDKVYFMNKNEGEDWWFFNGQCTAIQRLITLLDRDLEKFLEEK